MSLYVRCLQPNSFRNCCHPFIESLLHWSSCRPATLALICISNCVAAFSSCVWCVQRHTCPINPLWHEFNLRAFSSPSYPFQVSTTLRHSPTSQTFSVFNSQREHYIFYLLRELSRFLCAYCSKTFVCPHLISSCCIVFLGQLSLLPLFR